MFVRLGRQVGRNYDLNPTNQDLKQPIFAAMTFSAACQGQSIFQRGNLWKSWAMFLILTKKLVRYVATATISSLT